MDPRGNELPGHTPPSAGGPIVTLFGANDVLGHALSEELSRRGGRTHTVSVAAGWFPSTDHAVVRLDTPAGKHALRKLTAMDEPAAHVVAICAKPADRADAELVTELCRHCGVHHHVALIWHQSWEASADDTGARSDDDSTHDLVVLVADEMMEPSDDVTEPAFEARYV